MFTPQAGGRGFCPLRKRGGFNVYLVKAGNALAHNPQAGAALAPSPSMGEGWGGGTGLAPSPT
jgi:hypothetical protein